MKNILALFLLIVSLSVNAQSINTISADRFIGGTFTGTSFTGSSITNSGLTATRVPFATTGGLLTDTGTFTFVSGTGTLSTSYLSVANTTNTTVLNATSAASDEGLFNGWDPVGGANIGNGSLILGGIAAGGRLHYYGSAGNTNLFLDNTYDNVGSLMTFRLRTSNAAITPLQLTGAGAVLMPNLSTSSAGTTGTMCWTTGTGNVNVDTTTTCLLSSAKYKQNEKPLNVGLHQVLALRPVSYTLRDQFNPAHLGEQIGFFAEDVAKVDSRLVSLEDDGSPHAVRYQQLTAVLTKAIQEQQAEIRALSRRLATLEKSAYHNPLGSHIIKLSDIH